MVLRQPDAPVESQTAARSALGALAQAGRFDTPTHTNVSGANLVLTHPQEVFLLGLDDLRAGRRLEAARPIGWRYLVEHAAQPVALAETLVDASGRHVLGQVNYGPFVAGTSEALRVADALETPSETTPHLLHVPALHFLAVWLDSADGQHQLIPISPTPPGLDANRAYPAAQVLDLLGDRVRAEPPPGPRDTS